MTSCAARLSAVGGIVYYDYDAAGQRVRKVWEHSGLIEERVYLGGYEVYRKRNATGLLLERQTLHVMDDRRRVAMVETKTADTSGPLVVTPRVRFQLDNHLGSASLEVDGAGLVIGYEGYHPFGTTAYWSGSSAAEVSRTRYRYTGKERDEETGLYYHGARYYACWLGRWTAADPVGIGADGPNLYDYVRANPVNLRDPSGHQGETNPELDNLIQGLAATRVSASPEAFHRFLLRNEAALFKVLHPFGYQGSRTTAEASAKDFDRAFTVWQKVVDSSSSSPLAERAARPDPPREDATARQKMWATAASDPVAAAFIGSGAIVSAMVGRTFGFEQDPKKAAAGGESTSSMVHSVGAVGAARATGQLEMPRPVARNRQQAAAIEVDLILSNPGSLWGWSPADILNVFRSAGHEATLRQSGKGSGLAEIIEIKGHGEISQIQVHPSGGRHEGSYVKISTSTQGTIKVVDPRTCKGTSGEKATIVEVHEERR